MSNAYLDKWSNYAKKDIKWEDHTPRDPTDYRKRVRRETVRGKTTVFHENIEEWIYRQLKAYTTFRQFIYTAGFGVITYSGLVTLTTIFHDPLKYKNLFHHPSYAKLGPFWTSLYFLRSYISIYIFLRLAKFNYKTCKEQWKGNHDPAHTYYFDEHYYYDMYRDMNDGKNVNFRYSDHTDRSPTLSHFTNDVFKPDADYAKGLIKHFREKANSIQN